MNNNNVTQQSKFGNWLKSSKTAKMVSVGVLILILLIPLSYIKELINERADRQKAVTREINTKWGEDVCVYGPILKVPYKTYNTITMVDDKLNTTTKETKTIIKYAYIFPEELDAKVNVKSKTLKRGNYQSAVYTSTTNFSGMFPEINLANKDISTNDIVWDKITAVIKTTNLKGIKNEVTLNLNSKTYPFQTNYSENKNKGHLDALESDFLNISNQKTLHFNVQITFNGSEQITIVPIGKTTTMSMVSNWANPSFIGNYLPDDNNKTITAEGFNVNWKVLHINRAFSQVYLNTVPNLNAYAFGTKFMIMVDEYQKSERSAKYGFLVIALTFLVFFLIQTLSKINIHPFQYLMIGLALTMFYTLLISISEHSNFLTAYSIATLSVVILISWYSKSILKTIKFTSFISIALSALYIFIFVIIQLENYALLVGSIGLFFILTSVMFISRKIDWNN
ncbi:cell envelope integrity protein CreD [Formosa sp. A9]|uniref:cell envelope integrity protein CreD n=1 Tax=Formosa sp. A9 TaxID=3442641 RepID=UPI003EBFA42B